MADLKKDMETLMSVPVAAPADKQGGGLTDEEISDVWNSMPGGHDGFLKQWGYLQFARAVLARVAPSGEAVAEVVSAHGDPEAFGEREIKVLSDLSHIPYGTKLYAAPQPSAQQAEPPRYEWSQDGKTVTMLNPEGMANYAEQPAESRVCNACDWTGSIADCVCCGSVGPLCPKCNETTDVAEQPAEEARGVDERAEFERVMGPQLLAAQGEYALSRAHESGRPYTFLATKWAWEAWQAARALLAAPAAAEAHKHDWRVEPPYGLRCKTCGVFLDEAAEQAAQSRQQAEPIVWANDATPFTGPQVLALLRENEALRRERQAANSRQPEGAALTDEEIGREWDRAWKEVEPPIGIRKVVCATVRACLARASVPREALTDAEIDRIWEDVEWRDLNALDIVFSVEIRRRFARAIHARASEPRAEGEPTDAQVEAAEQPDEGARGVDALRIFEERLNALRNQTVSEAFHDIVAAASKMTPRGQP